MKLDLHWYERLQVKILAGHNFNSENKGVENMKEEPGKRHQCGICGKGFHDYWECMAHEKKCKEENNEKISNS